MKGVKRLYPSLLLVLIAMIYACSADKDGPIPGGETGQNGFLAVEMAFEDILPTRADTGQSGIDEECIFNSIAFILYDAATGKAARIDSYTLSDDGTVITATDSADNLTVATDSGGKPVISKVFDKVAPKEYKLAVILNSGVGADNLNAVYLDREGAQTLGDALAVEGHDISILENPLELTQYDKGGSLYTHGIGQSLTAMPLSFPGNVDMTSAANTARMRIVMTNADGLFTVYGNDVYGSKEDSQLNKINIRLERAVAKVAVFKNLNESALSYGAKIEGFRWTSDILNNHMFLVRHQAKTAPAGGGAMENAATERIYRYALDPNFDGYSKERNAGATANLSDSFFRLEDMPDGDFDKLLFKTWNTISTTEPAENWTSWEYVTENTMAAEEQYEDVTTRVVIRCNYIPGSENSTATIQPGESYYHFNGLAITSAQMKAFYDDPGSIPVSEYPGLDELAALLAEPEVSAGFGWPEFFDSPSVSKSVRGISYFHQGVNYYAVLIRHFNDQLSPEMMGYGRYGVVRNNVYKVSVNDIKGPGSIGVPDPVGPDDKEFQLEFSIEVAPWNMRHLVFEL